jgi:hypothetical protein
MLLSGPWDTCKVGRLSDDGYSLVVQRFMETSATKMLETLMPESGHDRHVNVTI